MVRTNIRINISLTSTISIGGFMDYNKIKKILQKIKGFDLGQFNKTKRIIIDIAMIVVGLVWIVLIYLAIDNEQTSYEATFIECVDGDTVKLKVNYKNEAVRLLAVDTPEIGSDPDYYGPETSEYTCNLVSKAKEIRVELDDNASKYDKYGRLLAWVFIEDDLLQSKLVALGYAKVAYLYDDYSYTSDLQKLEKKAKKSKLGIWSLQNDND